MFHDIDRDEGWVSVWAGRFDTSERAEAYLEEQFDDDEAPISSFAADIGIGFYDHDFLEWAREPGKTLATMMEGFSYIDSYRDDLAREAARLNLDSYDTVLALYRLKWAGQLGVSSPIALVGVFRYSRSSSQHAG